MGFLFLKPSLNCDIYCTFKKKPFSAFYIITTYVRSDTRLKFDLRTYVRKHAIAKFVGFDTNDTADRIMMMMSSSK